MQASEIICLESCTYFLKVRGKTCISIALCFGGYQRLAFFFFNYTKETKGPDMNVLEPVQQAHAAELLFKDMKTQIPG